MNAVGRGAQSRRLALALGTSMAAIGAGLATPAAAQCAPDPTVANGTTTCSGTDPDGIRVTTTGTTVNVLAGATVNASTRAAIGVDVSSPNYASSFNMVNVAGKVTGARQPGVAVYANGNASANLTLTVSAGGSVSGTNAVLLTQNTGAATYAGGNASVDNSGTLTGTGGFALLANGPASSFGLITNRATGTMGAILGGIGTLTNAGVIDGGANSAVNATSSNYGSGYPWTNTGTIRSASTAATIQVGSSGIATMLTNSGTIANSGSGAAIAGAMLTVQNQAGGRISSGGTTAINATTQLNLVNLGTIVGDVVASMPSNYYSTTTIDSSGGSVIGSLRLGAENDALVARYTGSRTLATGFTGTVDGGGGLNTEQIAFAADTVVTGPVDLATNFQQLGLAPAAGVTATLGSAFQTAATVVLAGAGSIVNRGRIAASGQAMTGSGTGTLASFSNEGTISGASPSNNPLQYIVQFSNVTSVSNSGTIFASGGGVYFSGGNKFTNTGSITASGTAVSTSSGALDNRGTITSTGGTGLVLYGSAATNSGIIRGASIGVDLGGMLTNTGTIASNGVAVTLEGYGALINAAGGTVTGGNRAVTESSFNGTVVNAGTINGAVAFTSTFSGGNRYIAQTGGVLNGSLTLGSGDLLLTDLVNTGQGQFAGINGTVNAAGGALLRYRVASDASATLGAVGPFAIAGYELGNAKLTLTSGSTVTRTLVLAGAGSVDVNAAFSVNDAPVIQSSAATSVPGATSTPATALTIISRGAISYARTSNNYGYTPNAAVILGGQDSFTNLGTISITEPTAGYGTAAILGGTVGASGASVTNAGAIRLNGGYGVIGVGTFNNTGSITQLAGGATAQGVSGVTSINNSGTISVGGTAVQLSQYASSTLTNSGVLRSTGGIAIAGSPYGYGATITNLAGATIVGGAGLAAQMTGGSFTNAGAVTGTVDLGYSSYGRSYASAAYVAKGGTITGDLLFGSGADLFLQTGATTGVSGVVDGGPGQDIYGRVFGASGSFALDVAPVRNFEDRLVQAVGPDTVVTTTSGGTFAGNLYAIGTGSVTNQASIAGQLLTSIPYQAQAQFSGAQGTLGALTNMGSIAGGVFGSATSFTNSGTIGSARLATAAVSLQNTGPLSFSNSGQIAANPVGYYGYGGYSVYGGSAVQLNGTDSVTVANGGTVTGGLRAAGAFAATDTPGSVSVANAGAITISNSVFSAIEVDAYSAKQAAGGGVSITNSGSVAADSSYAAYGLTAVLGGTAAPVAFNLINTGSIGARGGSDLNSVANALAVLGTGVSGTITNAAGGSITASATNAYAIIVSGTPLLLDNAGLISATGATTRIAIRTDSPLNNLIRNTGSIIGDILLSDGADRVENAGSIVGNVLLGAGNDVFVQRGGTVGNLVDGGDGMDLLQVDASGGGAIAGSQYVNFERVQQVGTGNVTYSGAFGVDTIELAGGGVTVAAGTQLSTTGATTITGTGGGVSISNAGTIAGGITLGDGGNSVANSGAIGGPVRLGAGNDSFRTTSGATLGGIVDGGAGYDTLTLALSSDTMLKPGVFRNFEALSAEGASTLILAGGAFGYDRVSAQGNLAVASDASLAASVAFGAGDNRFSVAGGFTGSVDGGAGNDTVEVSGGTQAAPVAFSSVSNVEAYRQTAGFATLAGSGNVGAMYLGGGRFVGLAGSTLTAAQIGVDTGATFGSAGVVNGNIAVAGTLSPGASPGTMTVNGNVSLLGGSVSLFELTPAVSDKLVVNGAVGIAPGATLQLAPTGFTGNAVDLVTASGGVSGAFTTLSKPASLNGFLSYQATRIQFVTAFTGDPSFSPPAARALAYTNTVLTSGQASAALLAGLPRLLTATGATNAAAFNRLTPEAYASAQQIAVENGLSLAQAARGDGFAPRTDAPGLFSFGELQGDWRTLGADRTTGVSRAVSSAQGLLGGVGIGGAHFSLGAFAGYRWASEQITALDARTRFDGETLGLHARVHGGGFALVATGAYSGGDATTSRATPDGSARARYRLHGWTGDVSASYQLSLGANWRLLPHVGGTVVRELRGAATETGGSGFALFVQRRRETASFIDGGLTLGGGAAPAARVRPFVSLGARWQLEGRQPLALAGFGGGAPTLLAVGARRAEVVGTGALGLDAMLSPRLSVFAGASGETGGDDHRVAAHAGLRARF